MIPFFDAAAEYRRHGPQIDAAVRRVLEAGQLVLGPEVDALEREFAAFCGARHGVGLNSGTDALALALRALGVGPGDDVVTVANAGVPTVAAIAAVGARPRFADVCPDTLLMDPASAEAALTPRTRALLPVHLYGRPADLPALVALARLRSLALVEDCAQAHGAARDGRAVGGWGSVGCFSFYPTKNLGACGDGGMAVTDAAELAGRLRRLRTYGWQGLARSAVEDGVNSRLDELQAAIVRVRLAHLGESLERRRRLARLYLDGLHGLPLELPAQAEGERHAWHLFVVRAPDRERLAGRLAASGVATGVHYPEPVHVMPAYRSLGYAPGDLPVTEAACGEVLSLPLHPSLREDQVERVVELLRAAL